MGVQHSLNLADMAKSAEAQLTSRPRTSLVVVILPNTPVWGKGSKPAEAAWEDLVEEAKKEVVEKFKNLTGVRWRMAVGIYSAASCGTLKRERKVDIMLVASKAASKDVDVIFQKSPTWQYLSLVRELNVLPRAEYEHCSASMVVADRGNVDWNVEYRQWHSGADMWDCILCSLCSGVLGSNKFHCQVRDWTMYDPHLAKAVANIRGRNSTQLPEFAYVGATTNDFIVAGGGKNIQVHVEGAVNMHLATMLGQGTYKIPGVHLQGNQISGASAPAVPAAPVNFLHTVPRDKDLPLKQSLYDHWSLGVMKSQWEELVKVHDMGYNKSGVPHKARRPAPINEEAAEAEQAIVVAHAGPSTYSDLKATLAADQALVEVVLSATLTLIATPSSNLYIWAKEDTIASASELLYSIKGKFHTGQAGTACLNTQGARCIEWSVTGESPVTMTIVGTGVLPTPLPATVQPLNAFLSHLEQLGFVRMQLHKHSVERKVDEVGKYNVKVEELAVLEPTLANTQTGSATLENLSAFVDVALVKESNLLQIVHRLETKLPKTIISGYPGLYLKKPIRMVKNQVVKLA